VVPNNGGYGEIRDQMRAEGIDPVGVRVDGRAELSAALHGAGAPRADGHRSAGLTGRTQSLVS
jgi:hypothetical protein